MSNAAYVKLLCADIQRLRAQHPTHYLFALLDPHRPLDAEHPLHLDSLRQQEPKLEIQTVLRPDLKYLPALCPHLLELAKPNDTSPIAEELLSLLAAQAVEEAGHLDGAYVCGVLVSTQPALATAQHLAQAMVVRLSADAPEQVLALFEPLRLESLSCTMPQDWLDAWLGPIVAWRYLNAAGKLRALNRLRPSVTPASAWVLSTEAGRAQHRIPQLADLLQAWRENEELPQDAAQRADAQLEAAAQHGLTAGEDLLFFALTGLTLPAQWATHPATKAAIQRAVQAECTLAETFDKLDARTLNEIMRPNFNPAARTL